MDTSFHVQMPLRIVESFSLNSPPTYNKLSVVSEKKVLGARFKKPICSQLWAEAEKESNKQANVIKRGIAFIFDKITTLFSRKRVDKHGLGQLYKVV